MFARFLAVAVSLKAVHSTTGPKTIFPHFLSVKKVWHIQIIKKKITIYHLSIPYFSIKVSYDRSFQKVVTFKRP